MRPYADRCLFQMTVPVQAGRCVSRPGVSVRITARDDVSDLALLRGPVDWGGAFATFRPGRGIRPGAGVVVDGYPLRDALSCEAHVTKHRSGAISWRRFSTAA